MKQIILPHELLNIKIPIVYGIGVTVQKIMTLKQILHYIAHLQPKDYRLECRNICHKLSEERQKYAENTTTYKQLNNRIHDKKKWLYSGIFGCSFQKGIDRIYTGQYREYGKLYYYKLGYRSSDYIDQPTGLMCIDIDMHKVGDIIKKVKEALMQYKYCIAAFTSPSGSGVKALIWIPKVANNNEFKYLYRIIKSELPSFISTNIDTGASSIVNNCFLSHDEDILINSDVTCYPKIEMPAKEKKLKVQKSKTVEIKKQSFNSEKHEQSITIECLEPICDLSQHLIDIINKFTPKDIFDAIIKTLGRQIDITKAHHWNDNIYKIARACAFRNMHIDEAQRLIWQFANYDNTGAEEAERTICSAYNKIEKIAPISDLVPLQEKAILIHRENQKTINLISP